MDITHSLISAAIPRSDADRLVAAWAALGLDNVAVAPGRSSMLRRRHGLGALLGGVVALTADPADFVHVLVPSESEPAVMARAAEILGLDRPGRGTLFSRGVTVYRAHPTCVSRPVVAAASTNIAFYTDLVGVECVVQRGEGDQSARVVLEAGACVPITAFGHGMGLRDRLGLLRITVPAEKEVISAVVSSLDSEHLIEQLVSAGKLDQPGRGFLQAYPIGRGVVNHGITQGEAAGQAASLDQIIASIDNLRGGIEWRSRGDGIEASRGRRFLTGVTLQVSCNEGRAVELIEAAMAAGALGATICKTKLPQRVGRDEPGPSPARETATLTVPEQRVPEFVRAFEAAGAFDDRTHGLLLGHPVIKAVTYLPGRTPA